MSELEFKESEFKEIIEELVPSYQKETVYSAFEISTDDFTKFDSIGLELTGEKRGTSFIYPTGVSSKAQDSMWGHIKSEIYDYLCTKSKKYTKERKEAGVTIKNIVTIIATAVAAKFSIAVGVITGAVTVALMSALKIGKNAWCQANKLDKK